MDMGSALLVPRWRWSCFLKSKEVQFICCRPCSGRCHVSGNVCRSGAFVTEIIAEVDLALCAKQQQLIHPRLQARLFQQYHQSIIPVMANFLLDDM